MDTLDRLMRLLAGAAGAAFAGGAVYLMVTAATTAGIGMSGTFFGALAILSLATGIGLLYLAFKPGA